MTSNTAHDEKLGFATRDEAQAAVTTADYRYEANLKVYKCRDCELWHIATKYEEDDD